MNTIINNRTSNKKHQPFSLKHSLIGCGLLLAFAPVANAQSHFCQVNEQIDTAPFVSGMDQAVTPNGTEKHPYRICNATQFSAIAANPTLWGSYFEIESDLNLSGYSGVIGTANNAVFSGTIDGKGHTLSNLSIVDSSKSFVGLVGYMREGEVKNLTLTSVNLNGGTFVGPVAAYVASGNITNVTVQGTVRGDTKVGGIVGASGPNSRIVNATAQNSLITGTNMVGGILGFTQDGYVFDATTSNTNIEGSYSVGGIAGSVAGGFIKNSKTQGGLLSAISGESIGGLVGNGNGALIRDSQSNIGFALSADLQYVGGLVGNHYQSITENSSSSGQILTGGAAYVGGLVGSNNGGAVYWSNATGSVSGDHCVGGLNGASGVIKYSYTTAHVSGGSHATGGLTGCGSAIYDSYATGDVYGTGAAIGGLIGRDGYALRAYSSGTVTAIGSSLGGSVGMIWSGGTYDAVFWDTDNNAVGMQDVATGDQAQIFGLPTTQMQSQSTFTGAGWDFAGDNNGNKDIWTIIEGQTYPTLIQP